MRRFFLAPGSVQGRRMIFSGKDARYICKVLRLQRGAEIVGFDGSGTEHIGTIAVLSTRRVEAIITASTVTKSAVSPFRLVLAQALLKGGNLDGVIRQATEIGISDFFPLATRYTIPRVRKAGEKRLERWTKIAVDAARQSGRKVNPVIHPVRGWGELLSLVPEFDLCLLPWEKERTRTLKDALIGHKGKKMPASILIAIGPEGGFSDDEAGEAAIAGFRTVSLGGNILRGATAGVVAVACVQYELGYEGQVSSDQ